MATHHLRRLAGVLVAFVVVLATVLAVPASAGVPAGEPYSCNDSATGSWKWSCWVSSYSSDPDRISDFTTAVQTVLKWNNESNDRPGRIDGWFGSRSRTATRRFQQNHSLRVDGIVGTNTWRILQLDLDVLPGSGSWYNYTVENQPYNAVLFRQKKGAPQYWKVYSWRVRDWVWMDRTRS